MLNIFSKKKFLRYLGNKLVVPFVNVLCKTLRINEFNKPIRDRTNNTNKNFVFAFWHGTMLAPWYALREYSPTAIISSSKDGDLLAKLLVKWNYKLKRGSSSRNGKLVLEELIASAVDNKSIAITPDGPRGPEREMKAGTAVLSKKSCVPIILVGVAYRGKLKLNSWDKFEIPYLFSRTSLIYSDPIVIDKNLTYDETGEIIKQLEIDLNSIQKQAETEC